ncbi:MAG: S-layer homology domain-containing protein [Clostridiales bacterium]|nr:S-layer homology domain-containing protein [Clostridiales bacterium]
MKRSIVGKIAAVSLSAVIALGIGSIFGRTAKAAGTAEEKEPNDSVISANSATAETEYYGSIKKDSGNDIDYYKFVLSSPGRISITSYADFDLTFQLYDAEETKLDGSTYWNGEKRASYDLTAGTYYFRLSGTWNDTGNYHFYYRFASAGESFPDKGNGSNNMISKANTITTGKVYKGQFAITDTIDYFKLVLDQPGKLNLTTNSEYYLALTIFDSKENKVYGTGYNPLNGEGKREITLPKGTYYLEFNPYYSDTGNYNFKLVFNGIKFAGSEKSVVCGDTMNLSLENVDSDWKVTWKSSNAAIAQVTDGRVLANKAGSVTIMATVQGKKVSRKIQVLYKDVTDSSKFWYTPTNTLTNKSIVQGYDKQTTFKPGKNCTRAQMVTFLWRLKGTPNPKSSTTAFKDVKKGSYYYKAVIWAVERGITTGYSKTSFKPDNVCTRAQTVTFLWRMAGKPAPKTKTNPFTDVKKKDYFYNAVLWASEKKIVAGYKDKTFKPQGKCLRRQMVTFLYKYSQNVK